MNGRMIRGWKAIADRLDVSERTARRMEDKGLPVVRVGMVVTTEGELKAWLADLKVDRAPRVKDRRVRRAK